MDLTIAKDILLRSLLVNTDAVCAYIEHLSSTDCAESSVVEKHHILPKSLYPEYRLCDWNIAELSVGDHIEAHRLMCQVFVDSGFRSNSHKMKCAYSYLLKTRKSAEAASAIFKAASEANRGVNNPMFGNRGENNKNYGKPLSEERRAKISQTLKSMNHKWKGVKKSEEFCARLSKALKGRVFSDEHRANISKVRIGKSTGARSEETKAKISKAVSGKNNGCYGKTLGSNPNAKRVEYNGVVYNSLIECAESVKVHKCTVSQWIKTGKVKIVKD